MSDFSKIGFTSKYRYEQVALKSHVDFTISGSFATTTATITHDLGIKPYFRARYTFGDGKYYSLFSGPGSYDIAGNGVTVDNIVVGTSTIQITFLNDFGAGTINGTVYYRIYDEGEP